MEPEGATLEFPYRPISSIEGGEVGFSIRPMIGTHVLGEVEVEIVGRHEQTPPRGFEKTDIVCVYLLYYGDDYIKVGTSRLENVVARMFCQAPLLGVIAVVIGLNKAIPHEFLEEAIIERLKTGNVKTKRPSLEEVVKVWNEVLRPSSSLREKLERVEDERDPMVILGSICEVAWDVATGFGEPLYDIASHWFIPKFPEESLPPPLRGGLKGRVKLRAYPNGLLGVFTGQSDLLGGAVWFTCDYGSLSNCEFEVVSRE